MHRERTKRKGCRWCQHERLREVACRQVPSQPHAVVVADRRRLAQVDASAPDGRAPFASATERVRNVTHVLPRVRRTKRTKRHRPCLSFERMKPWSTLHSVLADRPPLARTAVSPSQTEAAPSMSIVAPHRCKTTSVDRLQSRSPHDTAPRDRRTPTLTDAVRILARDE
jgi:hypothetical protein